MRPAFAKEGSVTAANASGLNDGAAATLLMSADEAEKRGIEPLARIASYATAGLDPSIMGVGPVMASRKALAKGRSNSFTPRPCCTMMWLTKAISGAGGLLRTCCGTINPACWLVTICFPAHFS